MERIEIERHHVPRTGAHIQNRCATHEVLLTPSLPAHHERSALAITPFEHNAARVYWSIEASRAVRHPQPVTRKRVEREVLAEHVSMRWISVGNRMIGSRERDTQVAARSACLCILCSRRRH